MLLIAAIAWAFFKKQQGARGRVDKPEAPRAATGSERMVACSTCGVFMPESESLLTGGKISCRDPAHCAHRPK